MEMYKDRLLAVFRKITAITGDRCQTNSNTQELFGTLRGRVTYQEDLTSPTIEEWGSAISITPTCPNGAR